MAAGLYDRLSQGLTGAENAARSAEEAFSARVQAGLTAAPMSQDASGAYVPGSTTYAGPTEYTNEELAPARQQLTRSGSEINATATPGGVQALMQSAQRGRGAGYTGGMSQFDAMLAGDPSVAGNRFQQLRDRYSGIYNSFTGMQDRARATAAGAQGQAAVLNTRAQRDADTANQQATELRQRKEDEQSLAEERLRMRRRANPGSGYAPIAGGYGGAY
jgi:hypothetical protein